MTLIYQTFFFSEFCQEMSTDNTKKRKREARKQAEEDDVFDYTHAGDYNIWYHKTEDHSTWKERRDAKYLRILRRLTPKVGWQEVQIKCRTRFWSHQS